MKIFKGKSGRIIAGVLAALCVIGALGFLGSFFDKDSREISSAAFMVGGLDEELGTYVDRDDALVTENMFECAGLKITPEFDSNVTFQIFWYNEDEIYLDCTEKTSMPSSQFVGGVPNAARYARVVIYPDTLDDDGKEVEDFKIRLWEINGYVNDLTIKVDKEQNWEPINLLDSIPKYSSSMGNKVQVFLAQDNIYVPGLQISANQSLTESAVSEGTYDLLKLDASKVATYKIDLRDSNFDGALLFYKEDGTFLTSKMLKSGQLEYFNTYEGTDAMVVIIKLVNHDGKAVISEYLYR